MLDLNRNIKPTIGNLSLPIRTFGPRELYGSKLLTHVDTMDYKNFSTDIFNKVNPPNTGETIIQSIFDISPYARRYNIPSALTTSETGTTWITTVALTSTTQGFSASSFDTNKGTFPRYDSFFNGQGMSREAMLLTPYAGFRNLAPNSGFTLCSWVASQGGGTNANFTIGMGVYARGVGNLFNLFQPTTFGSNVFLYVNTVQQNASYTLTASNAKTTMHLITVTGYNYYWYIDNILYSSGTITGTTLYPFTSSSSQRHFYVNGVPSISFQGIGGGLARTLEGFFASEYTTPEQVQLLYDYFNIKTKNKLGKFR
jgi:hypothetical protein